MIDPNTLSSEQTSCPCECSFLSPRHFLPDILPFYCDKFEQFLGVDTHGKTARCAACRMVVESIKEQGLSLIGAYTVPTISIPDTKSAFLELEPVFQKIFVDLIRKTGRQIGIPIGQQAQPTTLLNKTLLSLKEAKQWAGSPELKGFKDVLGELDTTLMTRATQTLLENLFQVLDKSEREMLKGLLSNPKTAESFLEQFHDLPQDGNLLKHFRHMLYENDDKERKRQQQEYGEKVMQQDILRRRQLQREDR